MEKGDKVIIRTNPYQDKAVNILGTVTVCLRGIGLQGGDILYVRYYDTEGKRRVCPLDSVYLEPVAD